MGVRIIENSGMFSLKNEMMYINKNRVILDKETVKGKLERHNISIDIINNGNYYLIKNSTRNNTLEYWEVISKDKSEVLLIFNDSQIENSYNCKRIRLKGLNEDAVYVNKDTNEVFLGGALMYCGVNIKKLYENYNGNIVHLKRL
ncbi:GH36 C-terminal domain-containing protein [Clostridium celatum]|uniref:GH36 C-terminal domain-containing protein n=1 Tax=Clostridium celatum TaxID=36834 RepID=UPI001898BAD2|nr:GH36 C-terminal domain-containing protein [Clostridium celatum]MCE9654089.1 GH36 C-terminal domain-containing protein [Clostridium celatum]MDU2266247.1 GH36 C-terminal domain-containing protein [Clostridium celatum]MDU3722348.1 GH36 C-terminal domain-containing protein [Clostridium celatum]MDU6296511.1 GH36 C-terminal domain-containing protein [Clostridium celatum]MDY3361408.1 GH36 C-terminal domain-containing protein [Clostridium celatum]